MPIKIVVTGPESSGKTSLCGRLSEYYKSTMIPEKSREYLSKTGGFYNLNDIIEIAKLQVLLNDSKTNTGDIIFCDTDALTCLIWAEEKYKVQSDELYQLVIENQPDFYVLCFPDLNWEYDYLRENKLDRIRLFQKYYKAIVELKVPFAIIYGVGLQRFTNARFLINHKFPELITFAS
jgi:nicotinamide riboside kinase